MPIYEYRCAACGAEFSEMRKMGDDAPRACPKCASGDTKKILSAFASFKSGAAGPACGHSHAGGGG